MEDGEERVLQEHLNDEKCSLDNLSENLNDLWMRVSTLITCKEGDFKNISEQLAKLLQQITELLIGASHRGVEYEKISCEFCQKNNTFYKIYNWTGEHRECLKYMALQQLQYFNEIIQTCGMSLLTCHEVIIPMMLLLMSLKPSDKRKVPPDIEKLYVNILQCISQKISCKEFLDLLSEDLFTNEGFKIPKFTFFELLISYIHSAGENGVLARKGIMNCIVVAQNLPSFQKYISEESAACVVSRFFYYILF